MSLLTDVTQSKGRVISHSLMECSFLCGKQRRGQILMTSFFNGPFVLFFQATLGMTSVLASTGCLLSSSPSVSPSPPPPALLPPNPWAMSVPIMCTTSSATPLNWQSWTEPNNVKQSCWSRRAANLQTWCRTLVPSCQALKWRPQKSRITLTIPNQIMDFRLEAMARMGFRFHPPPLSSCHPK